MPEKPQRIASLRIERDAQYPELIFRAILCHENGMETPQVLPCSFEGNQDVIHFFELAVDAFSSLSKKS